MEKDELLEIKEKIETAKTSKSKLEGKKENLMQRLKDDYGCETLEKAEKKKKKLQTEVDELEEEIEMKSLDFKEKYEL